MSVICTPDCCQDDQRVDGQEVRTCMAGCRWWRVWLWNHTRDQEHSVHVLWWQRRHHRLEVRLTSLPPIQCNCWCCLRDITPAWHNFQNVFLNSRINWQEFLSLTRILLKVFICFTSKYVLCYWKKTFDNIVCLYTCLDSFYCPMLLNCFTTYYEQKLQNFAILDLAAD